MFRYDPILPLATRAPSVGMLPSDQLKCQMFRYDPILLFGGRRNIYIWILAIALILGAPATGFIVMAWLQAATAAVHLPRVIWLLSRRKHS
jgi:hypothetical protein